MSLLFRRCFSAIDLSEYFAAHSFSFWNELWLKVILFSYIPCIALCFPFWRLSWLKWSGFLVLLLRSVYYDKKLNQFDSLASSQGLLLWDHHLHSWQSKFENIFICNRGNCPTYHVCIIIYLSLGYSPSSHGREHMRKELEMKLGTSFVTCAMFHGMVSWEGIILRLNWLVFSILYF